MKRKRGTTMFWSEEELINTMESLLNGILALHSKALSHDYISAKSIVFCEDGFVKLADQFATG
jgi:serine/threonine protein kinase